MASTGRKVTRLARVLAGLSLARIVAGVLEEILEEVLDNVMEDFFEDVMNGLTEVGGGILEGGILTEFSEEIVAGIRLKFLAGVFLVAFIAVLEEVEGYLSAGLLASLWTRFLAGFLPGFMAGVLAGFLEGFMAGILDGFLAGFLAGILAGLVSGIFAGILAGLLEENLTSTLSWFLARISALFLAKVVFLLPLLWLTSSQSAGILEVCNSWSQISFWDKVYQGSCLLQGFLFGIRGEMSCRSWSQVSY